MPYLREEGQKAIHLPPFLKKIFDMVENPNTNELISWSDNKESFIIWAHIKFSSQLLPLYFKHNNFSSFIHQLNNYGFRKIGWRHRWEYRNKWFQAGKEHLLCNIKPRHSPSKKEGHKQSNELSLYDLQKLQSMQAEFEKLTEDQNELKIEIQKLRQNQDHSMENRFPNTKFTEEEEEVLSFMMKAFENPTLIPQVIQHWKKTRLVAEPNNPLCSTSKDVNATNGSEETEEEVSKTNYDSVLPYLNLNFENHASLEEILMDDVFISENEANGKLAQHHSEIFLELKDLITGPSNCSNETSMEEKEQCRKEAVSDEGPCNNI